MDLEVKIFIFELFLRLHGVYERYVKYQRKAKYRTVKTAVSNYDYTDLIMDSMCWTEENQIDRRENPFHEEITWAELCGKWVNFVRSLKINNIKC